jgi:hypothetical protein
MQSLTCGQRNLILKFDSYTTKQINSLIWLPSGIREMAIKKELKTLARPSLAEILDEHSQEGEL